MSYFRDEFSARFEEYTARTFPKEASRYHSSAEFAGKRLAKVLGVTWPVIRNWAFGGGAEPPSNIATQILIALDIELAELEEA